MCVITHCSVTSNCPKSMNFCLGFNQAVLLVLVVVTFIFG